jgi:signal peptidase II
MVIIVGIGLDQLTKYLSVKYLMPKGTVPIIEGALHLTYVENRGAAFGMLSSHRYVFMIISVLLIIAVGVYLFTNVENKKIGVALAMILSGGVGNMIDRIAVGYVVDFIDFRLINFAVFNGADSFVCVGAALLTLFLIMDIVKSSKEKKAGKQDD